MATKRGTISTSKLFNNIKENALNPVYLILGEEDYFTKPIKKAFMELIPQQERSFNVGQYDMETTPLSNATDDAMSIPFFGEHRLVIITDPIFLTGKKTKSKIEYDTDSFIEYLKRPLDSTIMVIFAPYKKMDERKKVVKQLRKNAVIVDNSPMNEYSLRKFFTSQLKKEGYELDRDALDLMLERTDADLHLMMNEVPKLEIASEKEKRISRKTVEAIVPQTVEQNVFKLVDIVLAKNVPAAIKMYHDLLLQKIEPLSINAILIGQFRLMLQVQILQKHGYTQGNIASVLRAHPYRIKLAIQKARHFKRQDLKDAYLGLADVEEAMKSTGQDPELMFQLFMLHFAR